MYCLKVLLAWCKIQELRRSSCSLADLLSYSFVCSPIKANAFQSFTSNFWPIPSRCSEKATSWPNEADAVQYLIASAGYVASRCSGSKGLFPCDFEIFPPSPLKTCPEIAICFQGILLWCIH